MKGMPTASFLHSMRKNESRLGSDSENYVEAVDKLERLNDDENDVDEAKFKVVDVSDNESEEFIVDENDVESENDEDESENWEQTETKRDNNEDRNVFYLVKQNNVDECKTPGNFKEIKGKMKIFLEF